MPVSFHIGILPNRPLDDFTDWIARADELGFGGVWVADSQSVFRDAFMALALLAKRTRRMRLATGVTNVVTRHPAVLAHSFATLDELSDGRAILGIGVGESAVHTIGQQPSRLARFEEIIQVIRALMRGESVTFDGLDLKVSWPPRAVPVVIACTGPKSLQLAGRIADGVLFQVGADPALVRYAQKNIAIGAEQAGRDPAEVTLYQRLACGVSADREKVRAEVRGYASVAAGTLYSAVPRADIPDELYDDLKRMKERYDYQRHGDMNAEHAGLITDRILDAVAIAGTPAEAVPRFRELMDMGVENFVLPIATKNPEHIVTTLAEHVCLNSSIPDGQSHARFQGLRRA
jgi:5,10-methylenetetrahydromethanopterin reductase